MKKILIANIFGIGDVLFTTPLISNLKNESGAVQVDYLCNARTRPVLECVPDIEKIFVYEKDDLVKKWRTDKRRYFSSIRSLFSGIHSERYDVVFDLTLSRGFGAFFALCGIKKRIGYDYKKRGSFLTHKTGLSGFTDKHVAEYYLDLLKHTGTGVTVKNTQIIPDEICLGRADAYLSGKNVSGGRLAAVIPGGGASWGGNAGRKRWGYDSFAAVSDMLCEKGVSVAILGNGEEEELCRRVAGLMKNSPVFVENGLSLKEYISLLARADLVICNDGGPLHIAVALGVKTVSIFGPVDERVYGPYPVSGEHVVIRRKGLECRPCYNTFRLPACDRGRECLSGIDPAEVVESSLVLLNG